MAWTQTHPSLLRRLRDPGDDAAWHRFDRLYGGLIVAYGCRRGLDLSDAEDLRQTVLVSLVRSLPNFEFRPEKGRFRSYLGRVVGSEIARLKRRPYLQREVLEGEGGFLEQVASAGDPDSVWEEEWRDHHLRRGLAHLRSTTDPGTIEVFERLLSGASVADVSEELGLSTDAIHKIKQRFRDRLRARIAAQIAEEDS